MSEASRHGLLLFSFDYPPLCGGVARLTSNLVRQLGRQGVEVSVLTRAALRQGSCAQPAAAPELRLAWRRPFPAVAAWRRLRLERPGLVVCGIWYPEGLIATLAGVRPLVVLAHGGELLDGTAGPRGALRRRLRRRVLESADLVVANSGYTRALIAKAAPRSRATTALPGVEAGRFSPAPAAKTTPSGRLVIGTVSRLFRYKGHEVVLSALAGLPRQLRRRVVYRIAGTGPDGPWLRSRAAALGVRDRVEWCGHVPESELAAFYRAADLVVLCSREEHRARRVEGFGIALLEAQACGVPVVASRSGGMVDAVDHGRGGWLIEPDDHRALGRLLERLIEEPDELRRAGRAARARVEHAFTLERYVERFASALAARGLGV